MDDQTLLVATAAGDETALRTLFERHAPWVAARLRRVMPADAVEDVPQETFVAVWRGAGRYKGGEDAGAWICGIARRRAALSFRKRGVATVSFDLIDASVTGDGVGADPAVIAIRSADLERAHCELSPNGARQRELVRMVYFEDRPVAEVANLLGVPPGTVKSRIFAARWRLRTLLTGEGI